MRYCPECTSAGILWWVVVLGSFGADSRPILWLITNQVSERWGGDRTQRGMDANSVLFTIYATDWINGKSLYEHLMRLASGNG